MANIHLEDDNKLSESPEMKAFLHALAIRHSNSMRRVIGDDGSAEEIIERAKIETERMILEQKTIELENHKDNKCDDGYIWDAALQRCVKI